MRNILLILFTLELFSCNSDNQAEPQLEDKTFYVQVNGVKWNGVTEISNIGQIDSLVILGIGKMIDDEAVIVMKIKFQGEGQYSLKKDQVIYYTTVGRDVVTSEYKPASSSIGQLVITKYDHENKFLQGTFELMLEKEWSNPENDINSIVLTEGNFKGIINN